MHTQYTQGYTQAPNPIRYLQVSLAFGQAYGAENQRTTESEVLQNKSTVLSSQRAVKEVLLLPHSQEEIIWILCDPSLCLG